MRRTSILGLVSFAAIFFAPLASAASISSYDTSFESFLPLILALVVAYFVRRWFIPQPLRVRRNHEPLVDEVGTRRVSLCPIGG